MPVTDYSTNAASNTLISGINIAEGCLPGNINDAIRQVMADIATGVSKLQVTTSSGSANAYILTLSPAPTTYTGLSFWMKPNFNNTGAATINVNGLGVVSIVSRTPSGLSALQAGELNTAQLVHLIYDGTQFQISFVGGITALTSDVVASGDGSVAARVTQITDTNGNEILKVGNVASAVNEITLTNAATGSGAVIAATGNDTNIDLNLQAKGTGAYNLRATTASSSTLNLFEDVDNGTHKVSLKAPSALAADVSFTLPATQESAKQVLQGDGSGNLSGVFLNRPAFIARKSSGNQNIAAAATNKVTFDVEDLDTNNCFDNVANHRFTPNISGYYHISAKISCSPLADRFVLRLYKNGSPINSNYNDWDGGSGDFTVEGNYMVFLNGTTDYLEVFATNSGSGTDVIQANSDTQFFGFLLNI